MSKHSEDKKSATVGVIGMLVAVSVVGAALRGVPIGSVQNSPDLNLNDIQDAKTHQEQEKPHLKVKAPRQEHDWQYSRNRKITRQDYSHRGR